MYPPQGHRSLRKGRVSIPGQVYLLTTTTYDRRPLFTRFGHARIACRCTDTTDTWLDASLLCWVLMPDHWHGLLRLGQHNNLGQLMNRWKGTVTRRLHQNGCQGPIWARSFHDHALRREENLRIAARYIVANPVRAGLARTVYGYPYWNATWL